jgi:uncharacterized protein YgbK (DUF1537 family)
MTVSRAALFSILPPLWPQDVRPDIRTEIVANNRQLVVLDDDPTGTQTVHDVAVVTQWDVPTLRAEFARRSHGFYILTNSRSLPASAAHALNVEVARNLRAAAGAEECAFTLVSRGDSTLRGHFPLETDALASICGPFDAILIAPYFEAGGRYTINNVHYVADGDLLVPVAETAFARDAVFGFRHSDLRSWVAEKARGRVNAGAVRSISIETIRRGGPHSVLRALLNLPRGAYVIINAAAPRDLEVVALATLRAEVSGRALLFRSAAQLVAARLAMPPKDCLSGAAVIEPNVRQGGLIVVGSHVPRTTEQLAGLRAARPVRAVEVDVGALTDPGRASAAIGQAIEQVNAALAAGDDTVLFTSRSFVGGTDPQASLRIGAEVSLALVAIVRGISVRPRFLVAKGGITSSDVATRGLGVRRAVVRGQLLPGVPVWQLGAEARFPGLNYVVFPGNVGAAGALADAVARLHDAD